jgi:hypothetical protein
LLTLTGCAKFTEVDPKGKNLLRTVEDLDQLLNYEFSYLSAMEATSVSVLINDRYPLLVNVPNTISAPVKTINSILFTWDEETDRAALTQSDIYYNEFYSIIGKVANPVLLMADAATGDPDLAKRLKAEAYVLRAYFHYFAVNLFAKAYNPATAATDGGVPYAKERDPLSVPNPKYTVQEVYDFILEDLQAAHDLDILPDRPANPMRVGKAFMYAVEAKARMSMHDFTGAATAASNALAIQDAIEDHRDCVEPGGDGVVFSRPELKGAEDLFYAGFVYLLYNTLTSELSASFEAGSIFYNTLPKGDAFWLTGLTGIYTIFSQATYLNCGGLSTIDMYLTLAECKIRGGDVPGAMTILNTIRENRVDPYTPIVAANAAEAFAVLKQMTRTEGWYGPRHFISLKRWNTEDAYKTTLTKTLLGVEYTLRPDSPLWVFPFPQNATGYNPNLTQNYE